MFPPAHLNQKKLAELLDLAFEKGDLERWPTFFTENAVYRITARENADVSSDHNRAYGMDANIRFFNQVDWNSYAIGSETPGKKGGEYTWRTSLNYEGQFVHAKVAALEVGDGFQDDLAFYRRTGVRKWFADIGLRPRPKWWKDMGGRELHPHITWNYYNDLAGRPIGKNLHSANSWFFADGGLLALGANIFNLGFFPCFLAYPFLYRPLTRGTPGAARLSLACVLATVVGLQLGALGVVFETVGSGISNLPLRQFLWLMQPIHLAIGLVEGAATAAIVLFIRRARPDLLALAGAGSGAPRSRPPSSGSSSASVRASGARSRMSSPRASAISSRARSSRSSVARSS